jgi:excisionase family DNA binding protein
MDSLENNLKMLIKESVREVLRETEFFKAVQPRDTSPLKSIPASSKKLAVKIPEAAEMLSLSPATIRRLVSNGSLKVSRKTRHVLIPIEELERIMRV